jgi:four helix bundle protein
MIIKSAKELTVYQKSYALAMQIFEVSKSFLKEGFFALTSQIRRPSRSVPMNLREAWAKRRYEAHFISKLTDCDGETNETDTSIDFACDCGYISDTQHSEFSSLKTEIGKMRGKMIKDPTPFLISTHS